MDTSYTGKFLRIDLSNEKLSVEEIPNQVIRDFIGGRGLGIKYLYDEVAPGVDPMGPENKLLLVTGLLGGTNAQGFSRWQAITKSPLTNTCGKATGGADFAAWIRFAGFDFLLIEGKASKPVYVYIEEDKGQIRDARELWGKDTQQTQDWLKHTHGRHTRVACIGPAGERLVRYAVIASERRTASRCGVGTVMGSKNLKAVAINAERKIGFHDSEAFKKLVQWQVAEMRANEQRKTYTQGGTTYSTTRFEGMGLFPVRNYREGHQEGIERLSAEEFLKIKTGQFGCYSCMTNCGQIHTVSEGPYAGVTSEGPEYETIWSFGGNLANTDIGSTVAADNLCDLQGLDTISAGNIIGFVYELYERGIISKADTDGLDLTWGNHDAIVSLVGKMARREGFGDLLAEGALRAAERIGKGAKAYVMHAKGMEMAAYEPRAAKAHGLSYATSNIGGSHGYGYARQEVFGSRIPRPIDRFADEGKGDIAAYNQKAKALTDTGILCTFAELGIVTTPVLGQLYVAAAGIPEFGDLAYLDKVGERILCLERAFNVREGFDRKDDTLPKRMLTEPLVNAGPAEGQVFRNLDGLLDEYYQSLGYTPRGIPAEARLRELGLEYIIKDMQKFW